MQIEHWLLILTTVIALASLIAIYFIVKANTESNRKVIERLTNYVIASDPSEYVILNQADEPKKAKPQPKEDRYVSLDEMTADDWEKVSPVEG